MIDTKEITVHRNFTGEVSPYLAALIDELTAAQWERLGEFRERMSSCEMWMDEMLIDFADALAVIKPIALPQFEPGWRLRLLSLAQGLYRIPREIFRKEMPEEYKELNVLYIDFVMKADAMGEDLLEFVMSIEKSDFEDARDLFRDLREGLARLETMLTARWRAIAVLFRR